MATWIEQAAVRLGSGQLVRQLPNGKSGSDFLFQQHDALFHIFKDLVAFLKAVQ